jgi:hypothetical protein
MQFRTLPANKGSNLFLTVAIFFANLDYVGLEEYAIKAVIGGTVWLGFKLAGDYFIRKMKSK